MAADLWESSSVLCQRKRGDSPSKGTTQWGKGGSGGKVRSAGRYERELARPSFGGRTERAEDLQQERKKLMMT